MDLLSEVEEIERLKSKIRHLETSVAEARQNLKEAQQNLEHAKKAQAILQSLAQQVQNLVHAKIATVVSSCLASVFEDPYKFKILFEQKRGRTEARLVFERDGLMVDPVRASGGGVVDIASFALRVSSLLLHRPPLSRVVVLDEPFRFVSQHYQENVRLMLEELVKDLQLQMVMVTHNPTYAAGKVVEID
jgi:ABC-type dipeptide/oligopeptide/nickel transport system ATPase subunit